MTAERFALAVVALATAGLLTVANYFHPFAWWPL